MNHEVVFRLDYSNLHQETLGRDMIRFWPLPIPHSLASRPWRSLIPALGLGLLGLLAPLSGAAADCRPVASGKNFSGTSQDFRHGLLWKIETSGAAPSYLFGTFHSSDPRITTLPCPVKDIFDHAASYTMEMITNGAGIVSMAEAMFFNDGKTLKQVLGEPLYGDTLRAAGASATGRPGGINNMKPWAVTLTLGSPRQNAGLFLDMALQFQATRQGKPTYGLETMQEQIAVFNGMSLEDQVSLLRDAVQTRQAMENAMEELTVAYLRRDLAALENLSERYKPADARVYATMMDRLLTQRNRNMAKRMHTRLQEGNTFIAVGALHLPGETGLLKLLSNAGHRVTRIY